MKKTRIVWGLYLVAASIIIILNELNLWTVNLYKIIASLLLLPILVNGFKNRGFARILFPIVIMLELFSDELSLPDISIKVTLLATLILSIGLNLMFPKKKFNIPHQSNNPMEPDSDNPVISGNFTGITKYLCSDNLKTVNLFSTCSGIKLFFDNVTLSPEGAIINCDIKFSGVDIFIPSSWKVINKTHCIGSGLNLPQKDIILPDDALTLTLKGHLFCSGINIKYI